MNRILSIITVVASLLLVYSCISIEDILPSPIEDPYEQPEELPQRRIPQELSKS